MKKELRQLERELHSLKEEQIRHSKFIPIGEPHEYGTEQPDKAETPFIIKMFINTFKTIIYVIIAVGMSILMIRR